MIDFKNLLDDEQYAAVTVPLGNVLVRANAGSGKTRVLTHRVAWLISEMQVEPRNIMMLTFTNKASEEMMSRIRVLTKNEYVAVKGGTFHSVAANYLREYADFIGYPSNFTILDEKEANALLGKCMDGYLEVNHIDKTEFIGRKLLTSIVGYVGNHSCSVLEACKAHDCNFAGAVEKIYDIYVDTKQKSVVMDFSDLLANFHALLAYTSAGKQIREVVKHVLCDEYQDVNSIQARILELLNNGRNILYVVGDPNQCIYEWRGSDISFIAEFVEKYNASEFYITRNYRSVPQILQLAEAMMCSGVNPSEVKITPVRQNVSRLPMYYSFRNSKLQDAALVQLIQAQLTTTSPEEIAVLVRTNNQANFIEAELLKARVPYKKLSGLPFFMKKSVKDVLAFISLLSNPKNTVAFERVSKLFPKVGAKTADKWLESFIENNYDFTSPKFYTAFKTSAFVEFTSLMRLLVDEYLLEVKLSTYVEVIVNEFYRGYIKSSFPEEEAASIYDDLKVLYSIAESYFSIDDFMQELVLDVNLTARKKSEYGEREKEEPKIVLSTVHKAKGLEWGTVYVPYITAESYNYQEAESRRVFYVALTRAKDSLVLMHNEFDYKPNAESDLLIAIPKFSNLVDEL